MSSPAKRDPYRLTGTTLDGNYLLQEYAGSGGMGAVYRGLQIDSGRQVAIKILKPDVVVGHPDYAVLFEREVKAVRCLSHPHIVRLLDSGTDQDISYMVMEWLEGPTLEEVISEGQLSIDRIIRIFDQICDAFAVAHDNHIIHLDVKPANVMLLGDEEFGESVKVIDFGMARVLTRDSGTTATRFLGTYQYCSPEHFGGVVSHLSDIYSLGVTLYQMVTGVIPFGTSYINAKRHPNLELPPVPSVRGICPELPAAVDQVIRKALNRDPRERYGSARQLFEDFSRAVGIDTTTRPSPKSATAQTASIEGGYGRYSLVKAWRKSPVRDWLLGTLGVLTISSVVVTALYLNSGGSEHNKDPNNQYVSQPAAPKPAQQEDEVSPLPRSEPMPFSSPEAPGFGREVSRPQQPQVASNTAVPSSSAEPIIPSIVNPSPEISRPEDDRSSPPPTALPRATEPGVEFAHASSRRVFDLINSQRRARGEKPLLWDDKLAALASNHSEDMVLNSYFSHQDRNGRDLADRATERGINGWKKIAENIAYNQGFEDPESFAVERWMASTKHSANILKNDFTHTGVGVVQAKDGRYYFTQVFMER